MKTNGVTFNHATKEIIITKAFEKEANKIVLTSQLALDFFFSPNK